MRSSGMNILAAEIAVQGRIRAGSINTDKLQPHPHRADNRGARYKSN
jgi:hypothetical protein